jgi:DNA polymerase-3 subunit epsilon
MPGFAVVDLQTTGLLAKKNDRVVEIAITHLDRSGAVEGQWETVVNPGRQIAGVSGITDDELAAAPTFAQIVPPLAFLLSGRVLVAHNAAFHAGFLAAEFKRAGYRAPAPTVLCTMQLAGELLPESGRSLHECCAICGIGMTDPQRASSNSAASAALLGTYLSNSPTWSVWGTSLAAADVGWPEPTGERVEWLPRGIRTPEPATFLQRVSAKLPGHAGPAEELDYLALLDRALLDQQVTADEGAALTELAIAMGLTPERCIELHAMYFDQLAAAAWSDGVLTLDEMNQLVTIGAILQIPAESVRGVMDSAR